jgi:hypothetical protein
VDATKVPEVTFHAAEHGGSAGREKSLRRVAATNASSLMRQRSEQSVLCSVRAHTICASYFPEKPHQINSAPDQTTLLDTISLDAKLLRLSGRRRIREMCFRQCVLHQVKIAPATLISEVAPFEASCYLP